MPELPEVENTVNDLREAGITGSRITAVTVTWSRTVGGDSDAFCSQLHGRKLQTVTRRGKFIVLIFDGDLVGLLHLRMSGRLSIEASETLSGAYDRVTLALDSGKTDSGTPESGRELRFHDPRKFGRFLLYSSADADQVLSRLGVEPLDRKAFSLEVLSRQLKGRRRRIKPLLLDQRVVAGLGNIYADESLWEAGIHPARSAASLQQGEIGALVAAIPRVLERALAAGGTSLGKGQSNYRLPSGRSSKGQNGLQVYGRAGAACSQCGGSIARSMLAQRSTHYCPRCQPEARIRGVLLDMDGTMIETERILIGSFQQAAAEWGLHLAYEDLLATIGKTAEVSREILREMLGEVVSFERCSKRAEELAMEAIALQGIARRPGLDEFLDELNRQGIPHAVATSTHRREAEYMLTQAGIRDRFSTVVCGDEVSNGKPAPEIYQRAAAQLGLEARDCLAIEDSEPGIRAAAAAGAHAVLIPDLVQPSSRARFVAARVCATLAEVTALLREGALLYTP
ncbi:MAG: bifunctional DNA-formamidopyrimidine glycosylase/DNA-(apurinic or apyrimidinic site) lyase [Spirochaetaceae bacterium]|nr:MAG: bifunctional DNA-formamidopyrimidine glycosylase/DNA-(apurinic or apyrimidinic site) lyase [Spirochaetaceae bacterium]